MQHRIAIQQGDQERFGRGDLAIAGGMYPKPAPWIGRRVRRKDRLPRTAGTPNAMGPKQWGRKADEEAVNPHPLGLEGAPGRLKAGIGRGLCFMGQGGGVQRASGVPPMTTDSF
mgnify:CR=1 FL=1